MTRLIALVAFGLAMIAGFALLSGQSLDIAHLGAIVADLRDWTAQSPLLVALFLSTFLTLAATALVLKALTRKRATPTTEAGK